MRSKLNHVQLTQRSGDVCDENLHGDRVHVHMHRMLSDLVTF